MYVKKKQVCEVCALHITQMLNLPHFILSILIVLYVLHYKPSQLLVEYLCYTLTKQHEYEICSVQIVNGYM